jgi:hypothetical protein
MHQARGDGRLGGEAQRRQIARDEIRAAADVRAGEHGAVRDRAFVAAPQIARVVQQRDQDPEHRAPRAQALRRGAAAVMPVDQSRERERHVERMAHVVVERVAGEEAGVGTFEQRLEIGECLRKRGEIDARITRGV